MLFQYLFHIKKKLLAIFFMALSLLSLSQTAVTFPFSSWSQIGSPQWRGRTFSKDGYTFTNTQAGCVMSVRVSKAGTGGCSDVGCSGAGCTLTTDCLTNSNGNSVNNCTPVNQGTSVEFCVDWANKTSQIIIDISFSIPITNPNFKIYDINTNNNFTDDLLISAVNCASTTIYPSSVTGMLAGTSYNSANGNIYQTNINNTCQGNCVSDVTVNFTGTVWSIKIIYQSNATLPVASTNPSFQYIYLRPVSGTTAPLPNISIPLPPCNSSSTTVNLGATATNTSSPTFTWSAISGTINSGAGTFSPNVTSPGVYSLAVTNSNGCTSANSITLTTVNCVLLPIELTYFKANCYNENEIILNWQTAAEKNNDYFQIQQMKESDKDFKTIGKIKGAGNSSSARNYSFTDKRDNKEEKNILYYRLMQIDKDGTFHYSNPIALNNCSENALPEVFPNPTEGKIYFRNLSGSEQYTSELFNPLGEKIISNLISEENSEVDLKIYGKGIYYLILSNASRKIQKKIIVQ